MYNSLKINSDFSESEGSGYDGMEELSREEIKTRLRDESEEVVDYAQYLNSKSRSASPGIAGNFVEGGQSDYDVAVMRPIAELTSGIEDGESLLEHLGKALESNHPAIQLLYGRLAVYASMTVSEDEVSP